MDNTKLIAALEGAAGPDRELDAAIEKALPCSTEFAAYHKGKVMSQWNERAFGFYNIGDEGREYRSPPYTASIDAALTLVPEGMAWTLYSDGSIEIGREPDAGCILSPEHICEATTPALAICIAALKARP